MTTEIDKLRGQVERLKDELRQRENATSYEVSVFVSGDWRTALRTPNRIPPITEAQRLSAERIAGPQPDYVKVVGTEQVWDNLDLVNEVQEERRNARYGQSPISRQGN